MALPIHMVIFHLYVSLPEAYRCSPWWFHHQHLSNGSRLANFLDISNVSLHKHLLDGCSWGNLELAAEDEQQNSLNGKPTNMVNILRYGSKLKIILQIDSNEI